MQQKQRPVLRQLEFFAFEDGSLVIFVERFLSSNLLSPDFKTPNKRYLTNSSKNRFASILVEKVLFEANLRLPELQEPEYHG